MTTTTDAPALIAYAREQGLNAEIILANDIDLPGVSVWSVLSPDPLGPSFKIAFRDGALWYALDLRLLGSRGDRAGTERTVRRWLREG